MMGPGMMGGSGGYYTPQGAPISIDEAARAVEKYISAYGGGLEVVEVMEFSLNFYAEVEEESTDIHVMELLVDKYTGRVSPEPGPNMMWNTKYSPMRGMMGNYWSDSPSANMPVSHDQAKTLAQQFLDANMRGLTAGEPETFYGYYTLHTLKDGEVEGMLSVNGYTSQVWYHSWHGAFIGMKELS